MRDEKEFFSRLKDRDPDIILKMVKCVISAVKRKRDSIDIFEITFKDQSAMTFSISKTEYNRFLQNCLDDMIKVEEYELCAEITRILKRKTIKKKTETHQK